MSDVLETRLHDMLARRAEQVESDLDGPTLRGRAAAASPAMARLAAPLLAAAVVVIIAVASQALTHQGPQRHPQPPGDSVSVPHKPTPTLQRTPRLEPRPSLSPTALPTTPPSTTRNVGWPSGAGVIRPDSSLPVPTTQSASGRRITSIAPLTPRASHT